MNEKDAAELLNYLKEQGLEVYVDGGWAVDALLRRQTREHGDLDIAMPREHVSALRNLLDARGYREQTRSDSWECNFLLADSHGRSVDVHSYALDGEDDNVFGVPYRREDLTGEGLINGCPVRCICPESLVKFHTGYEIDDNDYQDITANCERFRIKLPREYQGFVNLNGLPL